MNIRLPAPAVALAVLAFALQWGCVAMLDRGLDQTDHSALHETATTGQCTTDSECAELCPVGDDECRANILD